MAGQQDIDYPQACKVTAPPFALQIPGNPVMKGTVLDVAAFLFSKSAMVRNYFWNNVGFHQVKEISQLTDFEPRFDPTVVPAHTFEATRQGSMSHPVPKRRNERLHYTCADYVEAYRTGVTTPTAVAEVLLGLIQRDAKDPFAVGDEHSVAFSESNVEKVRAAAASSTQRYKEGKTLGPLDGVPVVIKDQIDLDGYTTWCGTRIDLTSRAGENAWCAQKWMDTGAVIIGKTSMQEMGCDTNGNNPIWGTPRNPHNPDYYCGGSSTGTGYALAAGLVPIGHGADGGGSIRIPSSFCGLYGLKPSHGRISNRPVVDSCPSVSVHGPMATNIDDLALAYRTLAVPDRLDLRAAKYPNPAINPFTISRTKKIGIFRPWFDAADHEVREACQAAVDYLLKDGYELVEDEDDFNIPYLIEGQRAHSMTILGEETTAMLPNFHARIAKLSSDFVACQRLRSLLMSHLAYLFKKYPGIILVTPTVGQAGWKIQPGELSSGVSDADSTLKSMLYVWLANFTGAPSISVPVGYSKEDMPIGFMGMAEWGHEEELLCFGKDCEGVFGHEGARRPAENWVDVLKLAKTS